LGLSRWES